MRRLVLLALLLASLPLAHAGLFGPERKVHADQIRALADGRPLKMRLYALNPTSRSFWRPWGTFESYIVTGEAIVTSPEQQRYLLLAIAHGVQHSKMIGLCFWPHHGIRVEHDGGQTTDILICLSCAGVSVTGVADGQTMPFSDGPGDAIDRIFAAHGLDIPRD